VWPFISMVASWNGMPMSRDHRVASAESGTSVIPGYSTCHLTPQT
jgi:hypothetical protein